MLTQREKNDSQQMLQDRLKWCDFSSFRNLTVYASMSRFCVYDRFVNSPDRLTFYIAYGIE